MDELRAFRDAELLHRGAQHGLVADEHSMAQPVVEGQLHSLDGLPVREAATTLLPPRQPQQFIISSKVLYIEQPPVVSAVARGAAVYLLRLLYNVPRLRRFAENGGNAMKFLSKAKSLFVHKGPVDLGDGHVLSSLARLSVPSIGMVLFQTLFNLVDTIFISWLGESHMVAISYTFPVQLESSRCSKASATA